MCACVSALRVFGYLCWQSGVSKCVRMCMSMLFEYMCKKISNSHTFYVAQVESLHALGTMTLDEMIKLLGPANGKRLFDFMSYG